VKWPLYGKLIQGDVDKALGWKPIPLFDRENYPELASMQVSAKYISKLPIMPVSNEFLC
jgi:hypothetical protein